MAEKILLVDDEPNVLSGIRRQLRNSFEIATAHSGREGLAAIENDGPFAVIVSDQMMPEMDGVTFLSEARSLSPDSIRVMLTGQATMESAVKAVNEGRIFRFLTKPIATDVLMVTLRGCVAQYRLITAERGMLKETVGRSVQVMSEILSLVNPLSFGQTNRIRKYVKHMARELNLHDAWQFELAAHLSQIGCVSVSPEILRKQYAGVSLSEAEEEAFRMHPATAANLLTKIPRLESVAEMIRLQQDALPKDMDGHRSEGENRIRLGAHLLKTAIAFDELVSGGHPPTSALEEMKSQNADFDPLIVETLATLVPEIDLPESVPVSLEDLRPGMVLDSDVFAKDGTLLARRGMQIGELVLSRLNSIALTTGLQLPIQVVKSEDSTPEVAEES